MSELKPRYKYLPKIYSEFISSIGSSAINIIGERVAKGILSRTARPVGIEDAEKIKEKFHIEGRNALTHLYLRIYAGKILGIGGDILEESPERSVSRTLECPYGIASEHFNKPLLCMVCEEYNIGMAKYLDENMRFRWENKISEGADSCLAVAEVEDPTDRKRPETPTSKLLGKLGKYFADRNVIAADTLSRLLLRMVEKVIDDVLGPNASLIAARKADRGGKNVRDIALEELDLTDSFEDSVELVSEIRKVVGCDVDCDIGDGEAEINVYGCPLAEHTSEKESEFMEKSCLYFTKGLLPREKYEVELVNEDCYKSCGCKQIIKKK